MKWRTIEAARALLQTEDGAVIQDWGGRVPIALVFPNSYAVGMSSLAMHGLYHWLNAMPDVACERAFASLGRREDRSEPVVTLESQRLLRETSLVAFSIPYEMDYGNVVEVLRRSDIPALARERTVHDPLVLMGGPAVSANPAVMGPMADAVMIGEAEESLEGIVEAGRLQMGRQRDQALDWLSSLPGMWVPRRPQQELVTRQWVPDLGLRPFASSVVCPQAEFGDMAMIELARGCAHACRFCLATRWYRPFREQSLDQVLALARRAQGRWPRVGLVSAAVSDYSQIDALVEGLRLEGIQFSVSSLRAAPLSETLLRGLASSGVRTLTIAPEAGSQRLRDTMRKGISREDIMRAVAAANALGFETLKLYYMVGLPDETEEDIAALIDLTDEIARQFDRFVVVGVSPFVPKAHTPWERCGMAPAEVLDARLARIRASLQSRSVSVRAESTALARVQGILARGGAEVGEALATASRAAPKRVEALLSKAGLDVEDYMAPWAPQRPLPWGMVDARGCPSTGEGAL
jgi:radical SAM superfamily enzyme YgiQ (UPF0313 family)